MIEVLRDGWTLVNTGQWLHLLVRDCGGLGRDVVTPGSHRRVPWASSQVGVSFGAAEFWFRVTFDDPFGAPRVVEPGVTGEETAPAFRIDRSSGYFRALVGLCSVRIVGEGPDDLPTNAQIALLLSRSGQEPRPVTAKTVERRLDYCAQVLGLKSHDLDPETPALRADRKVLADLALATGTVARTDLDILGA